VSPADRPTRSRSPPTLSWRPGSGGHTSRSTLVSVLRTSPRRRQALGNETGVRAIAGSPSGQPRWRPAASGDTGSEP
jgi:hypothetical protein